jgi:hypothetical protein
VSGSTDACLCLCLLVASWRAQTTRLASAAQGTWVEKRTVDGIYYYHHPGSGAVSWDKPDALKTTEELEGGEPPTPTGS